MRSYPKRQTMKRHHSLFCGIGLLSLLGCMIPHTGMAGGGGGGGGGGVDYHDRDEDIFDNYHAYLGENAFWRFDWCNLIEFRPMNSIWTRWSAELGCASAGSSLVADYAGYKNTWKERPKDTSRLGERFPYSPFSPPRQAQYAKPCANPNATDPARAREAWFGAWRQNAAIKMFYLAAPKDIPGTYPAKDCIDYSWPKSCVLKAYPFQINDIKLRRIASDGVGTDEYIAISCATKVSEELYCSSIFAQFVVVKNSDKMITDEMLGCVETVPRVDRPTYLPLKPSKTYEVYPKYQEVPIASGANEWMRLESVVAGFNHTVWFTAVLDFRELGFSLPYLPERVTRKTFGAFMSKRHHQIGRINPDGSVTRFYLDGDLREAYPAGICKGPDAAMWFTLREGNAIGRIAEDGAITTYPLPTPYADPRGIILGGDGALWFTEFEGSKVGRITSTGQITEYPTPTPDCWPCSLVLGADGNIWFTEVWGAKIGRITPQGRIDEVPVPWACYPAGLLNASAGNAMYAGPGREIWFAEPAASFVDVENPLRFEGPDHGKRDCEISAFKKGEGYKLFHATLREISRPELLFNRSLGHVDLDLANRLIEEGAFKEATGRPFP